MLCLRSKNQNLKFLVFEKVLDSYFIFLATQPLFFLVLFSSYFLLRGLLIFCIHKNTFFCQKLSFSWLCVQNLSTRVFSKFLIYFTRQDGRDSTAFKNPVYFHEFKKISIQCCIKLQTLKCFFIYTFFKKYLIIFFPIQKQKYINLLNLLYYLKCYNIYSSNLPYFININYFYIIFFYGIQFCQCCSVIKQFKMILKVFPHSEKEPSIFPLVLPELLF